MAITSAGATRLERGRRHRRPVCGGSTGAGGDPACGDGSVEQAEICDDGNEASGDGCGSCKVEDGWHCSGEPSTCTLEQPITVNVARRNLVIPDDAYDGSLASMACLTLAVPGDGILLVENVLVTVGLSHDYVSDLVLKLQSPTGTVTTLINVVGFAETRDTASEATGDGSDLATSNPITFANAASNDAETMGSTLGDNQTICKDDLKCAYFPSPGAGPGTDLDDFKGELPAGDWQLCAGDRYGMIGGTLDFVELEVTSAPR